VIRDNLLPFLSHSLSIQDKPPSTLWFHSRDWENCKEDLEDGGVIREMILSAGKTLSRLLSPHSTPPSLSIIFSSFSPFTSSPPPPHHPLPPSTPLQLICFPNSRFMGPRSYLDDDEGRLNQVWRVFSEGLRGDLAKKCNVDLTPSPNTNNTVNIVVLHRTRTRAFPMKDVNELYSSILSRLGSSGLFFQFENAFYHSTQTCSLFSALSTADILITPHGFQLTLLPFLQSSPSHLFPHVKAYPIPGVVEIIPDRRFWDVGFVYKEIGTSLGLDLHYHQVEGSYLDDGKMPLLTRGWRAFRKFFGMKVGNEKDKEAVKSLIRSSTWTFDVKKVTNVVESIINSKYNL